MIIVKNGYTLSETAQQEYTYQYQTAQSAVQRTFPAPAFAVYDDGEGNSAIALQTLQGDPMKLTYDTYPAMEQFDISSNEINLTATTSAGGGNYYFRWWTEQNGDWWYVYRSYRYREGAVTTTLLGSLHYSRPKWRLICTDIITQKNNYENAIYPMAREVQVYWDADGSVEGHDNYLYSQKRYVLLSSQAIPRTDYLYTVTGGIVSG